LRIGCDKNGGDKIIMKLNPNQIKRVTRCIVEKIEESAFIQSKDDRVTLEIVEDIIVKDLKMEDELEKEANALIKKFSAGYHSDELDFELLFKRAKHELAKKKGFKL
jgi:hypothetical protein